MECGACGQQALRRHGVGTCTGKPVRRAELNRRPNSFVGLHSGGVRFQNWPLFLKAETGLRQEDKHGLLGEPSLSRKCRFACGIINERPRQPFISAAGRSTLNSVDAGDSCQVAKWPSKNNYPLRTLLVDNYDSYTFNLFQLLAQVNGVEPVVVRNDELSWPQLHALLYEERAFDNIVISPGPGTPERPADIGVCAELLRHCHDVPILGVCMGHQALGHLHGAEVVRAPEPVHGRLSWVEHAGHPLFAGVPSPFQVVRYHSLMVDWESLPAELIPIAWTSPSGATCAASPSSTASWLEDAASCCGAETGGTPSCQQCRGTGEASQEAGGRRGSLNGAHAAEPQAGGGQYDDPCYTEWDSYGPGEAHSVDRHLASGSTGSQAGPGRLPAGTLSMGMNHDRETEGGGGGEPSQWETARAEGAVLMGLAHRFRPHYGVQFHPESIATTYGWQLMDNFARMTRRYWREQHPMVVRPGMPPLSTREPAGTPADSRDAAVGTTLQWECLPGWALRVGGSEGLFCALYGKGQAEDTFWLDSASTAQGRARFSFFGGRGGRLWRRVMYKLPASGQGSSRGSLRVEDASGTVTEERGGRGIFEVLEEELARWQCAPEESNKLPFDFCGGFVGYLGYELKQECGAGPNQHTSPAPDAAFFFADQFVAVDHDSDDVYVVSVRAREPWPPPSPEHASLVHPMGAQNGHFASYEGTNTGRFPLAAEHVAQADWVAQTVAQIRDLEHDFEARGEAGRRREAAGRPSLDVFRSEETTAPSSPPRPLKDRAAYGASVDRCLELIGRGESYELCLTTQLAAPSMPCDPLGTYLRLRQMNPAPYAAWLSFALPPGFPNASDHHDNHPQSSSSDSLVASPVNLLENGGMGLGRSSQASAGGAGGAPMVASRTARGSGEAEEGGAPSGGERRWLQVCCSSPERFLRGDRWGGLEAKPIKGTMPRGSTPEEDERLRLLLQNNEKDRAENLMIVDLLRNDLGRVCQVGSVHVPPGRLMAVESYAAVHQLVSTVRGQRKAGVSPVQCVRAAFPGGSMTGAPKLRSMALLDAIESSARGVYSGALGYFSLSSTFDFNIVIRTAVIQDGVGTTVGAGGAVVALSDREAEYEEMLLKAQALIAAVAAENGSHRKRVP